MMEEDLPSRVADDFDYDGLDATLEEDELADEGGGRGLLLEGEAIDYEYEYDFVEEGGSACTLIRLIEACDWAGTLARISSHPWECKRVGRVSGRTALHYACGHDAPAVVIQALLKVYPEASLITGTTNMNPLHVTCSSQFASVHAVRVLLEQGRFEQFSMRDIDGDMPLHAACRCGARIDVLEVLLRAHYAAALERDYEGLTPIHRLWVRYFVILGDDVIESVAHRSQGDLVGELLDAWNKTELLLRCAHYGHLDNTRPGAKLRFRAVHAAAAVDCPRSIVKIATRVHPYQIDDRDEFGRTPLHIAANAPIYQVRDLSDNGYALEHVVYSEPNLTTTPAPSVTLNSYNSYNSSSSNSSNRSSYSYNSNNSNHVTIDNNTSHNSNSSTRTRHSDHNVEDLRLDGISLNATEETHCNTTLNGSYPSVIEILLQANKHCSHNGAHLTDASGRLPLHIAISSAKGWLDGVKALITAYPEGVAIPDRSSKLYPFMIAASVNHNTDPTLTYEILRFNPSVLASLPLSKKQSKTSPKPLYPLLLSIRPK